MTMTDSAGPDAAGADAAGAAEGKGAPNAEVLRTIEAFLVDREIESHLLDGRTFVVNLPGEKRLKTAVHLHVRQDTVRIESFICRKPDEDFLKIYDYLLRRNQHLYSVAYTIDNTGDIYLVGWIPAAAVSDDELDRVLGSILETADFDFNKLLEIGFHTSIRREWSWRVKNGEPLVNLYAFRHLTSDLEQPGVDGMPEENASGKLLPGETPADRAAADADAKAAEAGEGSGGEGSGGDGGSAAPTS
nr:YbjN domain-containing protein [Dietzia timorensis]